MEETACWSSFRTPTTWKSYRSDPSYKTETKSMRKELEIVGGLVLI